MFTRHYGFGSERPVAEKIVAIRTECQFNIKKLLYS